MYVFYFRVRLTYFLEKKNVRLTHDMKNTSKADLGILIRDLQSLLKTFSNYSGQKGQGLQL